MKQHEVGVQRKNFKTVIYYSKCPQRKKIKLYIVGNNLGLFFECVVSALQLLHLLLGSVVLHHIGPLCGNGLQRTAVTQDFFIEKLE